ncbi:MAG TPA: spermidine synthase [Actinomycetes bacterium]
MGEHHEVVSNGVFLMDTRDGRSERALVAAALDARPDARRLLIGGLGVGFSLRQAVAASTLEHIDVVEIEQHLVSWHATHLRHLTGDALADPRVHIVVTDVLEHMGANPERYDVICLDVDNGPDWTVTAANTALYAAAGVGIATDALRPGGVLAVWSAHRSEPYARLLAERLDDVRAVEVEVRLARGAADVVYLGHRRV